MTNWPTEPFIRVNKGTENRHEIDGAIAVALDIDRPGGDYYLMTGPRAGFTVDSEAPGDRIDEWEEVTPVPTAELTELEQAFRGTEMIRRQTSAIQAVTSHLPADGPSQLGVVAEAAKQHDRGVRLSDDGYVARLLRMMPGNTSHPGYTDLLHAAVCSAEHLRWAGFPDPWEETFIEAAYVPLPVSEDSRFSLLVKSIGKFLVTRDPDSATQIGAVALAWAAKITEGGRA